MLGRSNGSVGGGGGASANMTLDLLWTNSAPSTAFAAQTISLDLSSYKLVAITCRAATTRDLLYTNICTIGAEPYQQKLFVPDHTIRNRYCIVTNTGVEFNVGFYFPTYANSSGTNDNAQTIPYKIYGIK